MKRSRIQTLCLASILCALSSFGSACADREHIRDDYGQHVRAFQTRQRVYGRAATGTPNGLDSEESAAIHKSYRSGLSGASAGGARDGSRVLILGERPNAGSSKE
jgi:hypothetical protein